MSESADNKALNLIIQHMAATVSARRDAEEALKSREMDPAMAKRKLEMIVRGSRALALWAEDQGHFLGE